MDCGRTPLWSSIENYPTLLDGAERFVLGQSIRQRPLLLPRSLEPVLPTRSRASQSLQSSDTFPTTGVGGHQTQIIDHDLGRESGVAFISGRCGLASLSLTTKTRPRLLRSASCWRKVLSAVSKSFRFSFRMLSRSQSNVLYICATFCL